MSKKFFIINGSIIVGLIIFFVLYSMVFNPGGRSNMPRINMDERSSFFNKAQKLLAKGDEDAAMKNFELLIAKYPDSQESEMSLLSLASIYEKRGDLVKAKDLYQRLIEKYPDSNNILKAQEAMDELNIKMLFSSAMTPDSFAYEVQKGDGLAKLAKKFNTTAELISKANNLKATSIRIGQKLKITKARFSIVVDKSQNILTLKSDGNILKTYRVSTGKDFSTPTGTFKITNKIIDPTWYASGAVVPAGSPENILGSRWMGISKEGYGIHGTTDPQSIGKQVTAGCVRLKNSDVEELYSIVPEGTEVVIVD